jgi:hypothetical protein
MSKLKILSAALIVTGMLATPAMARTSRATSSRYLAEGVDTSAVAADSHVGIPVPRVSAFLPAPSDGENCDIGDNPRIC